MQPSLASVTENITAVNKIQCRMGCTGVQKRNYLHFHRINIQKILRNCVEIIKIIFESH